MKLRPLSLVFTLHLSTCSLANVPLTIKHLDAKALADDISVMIPKRQDMIIDGITTGDSTAYYLSSLLSDGSWPDVDYTTGCDARRSNWPAQEHWNRILTLSGAWYGGIADGSYEKSAVVLASISKAMDWWNSRDFANPNCLDYGGSSQCPCGTAGLWNTNWYSNIIGAPLLIAKSCLLLGSTGLTSNQLSHCAKKSLRTYDTLSRFTGGVENGVMTGANLLDVASIGVDYALLTSNGTLLTDAYQRIHSEVVLEPEIMADGIRPDGSFGQHSGVLYNGNYGKTFANQVLNVELVAAGTQFAAGSVSRSAMNTLFEANRWMVFRNTVNGRLHWDFSVVGRFVAQPVVDNMASARIDINLDQVQALGSAWNSTPMIQFAALSASTAHANAGSLIGNRMFYANDYMVHRGPNYVTSLKMFSARTDNSECINSQNTKGFHLSDGTLYTYLVGDEYTDIQASWDWNLIPGTTTDYGNTALACSSTQWSALDKSVGGVSDGTVGIAVMRYTNPANQALHWQKSWFFLDGDVQHVLLANTSSTSTAPVYSVLDQRLHRGGVFIDSVDRSSNLTSGATVAFSGVKALWHGGVGYQLDGSTSTTTLNVRAGNRSGDWAAIGISTVGTYTKDLYAAWLRHNTLGPITYTIFPGTASSADFISKKNARMIQTVQNGNLVSAVFDSTYNKAYIVFWDKTGGTVAFSQGFTVKSNGKATLIYNRGARSVTVSDPQQTSLNIQITIDSTVLSFTYPTGGTAGSSQTKSF